MSTSGYFTYIKVKTQFEALHEYKDAPEEVKFLRNPHRHLFKVELTLETKHTDREIEFFILKKAVEAEINNYRMKNGMQSCEALAKYLVVTFEEYKTNALEKRNCRAEVSEDGENAGFVTNKVW